jgi:hypothetical protein
MDDDASHLEQTPDPHRFTRRGFLRASGAGTVGGVAFAAGLGVDTPRALAATQPSGVQGQAAAASYRIEYTMPTLTFQDATVQADLGTVYEAALTNVVGINAYYADPSTYNWIGHRRWAVASTPAHAGRKGSSHRPRRAPVNTSRAESARACGKAIGGGTVTDDAMPAVALHLQGQELSLRSSHRGHDPQPQRACHRPVEDGRRVLVRQIPLRSPEELACGAETRVSFVLSGIRRSALSCATPAPAGPGMGRPQRGADLLYRVIWSSCAGRA